MKHRVLAIVGVLALATVGVAWAKGDWSTAQSKAEEMKRKQIELRKMTPKEVEKIVEAACKADEDKRSEAAKDAAERVASTVNSELSSLRRMRDDAYRAIDDVLADDDLKSNHDSAKRLREDVSHRWNSIERMAENAMRGGNHPLVSYLSQKGIEEHQRYQQNSSNCDTYEFETGSRRADCLKSDGDTCYVIELKPNNSTARSRGETQARESRDDLRRETDKGPDKSDMLKRLFDKSSKFKGCKRWEYKLKCYSLCPDIDEEGRYREGTVSWSDC
jgi:hypothetical protein